MRRQYLVRAGIAAAALLAALMLLLALALGTQTGSRALWSALSGAIAGLQAGSIRGRFSGPLAIEDLRYETDALRVTVGSLRLDWAPSALLRGELRVLLLHADAVAYTQLKAAPSEENSEPFALPERLSAPVDLSLSDVVLRDVAYRAAPEAEPLRIDEAALDASYRGSELDIDGLAARGPRFRIQAVAEASTSGDYPMDGSVAWEATLPDLAPVSGDLSIDGNLCTLLLEQQLASPYRSTQRLQLRNLMGARHIDLRVEADGVRLQEIRSSLPESTLSGTLRADGEMSALSYGAELDLDAPEFGVLSLRAIGAYRDRVVALEQLRLGRTPGSATLQLAGRADMAASPTAFEVTGEWQSLAWPLAGEPRIESSTGEFSGAGTAKDYSAELTAALTVPGRTSGDLLLSGSGSDEAFEVDELRLELLDGFLAGSGKLRWSPQLAGALTLDGEGLDPSLLAPAFPGALDLKLQAEGGVNEGALEAELQTLSIDGTLREQPLAVQAKGGLTGERFALETLQVQAGDSRVQARGLVGDSLDLAWDIDSPDLGDLLPDAGGSLTGKGKISGDASQPAVRGELEGQAIAYGDYSLQRLSLDVDVDLERETPSRLELMLDDLRLADTPVERFTLSGSGTRSDHSLQLVVDSATGAARLGLEGQLQASRWQGALVDGELRPMTLAPWTLEEQQPLAVGTDAQELERGCWNSGDSRLCLQAQRSGDQIGGALALSAFGLEYLAPLLPPSIALSGTVEANARFEQSGGASPQIEAAVTADGVKLSTGKAAAAPGETLLALAPSELELRVGDTGLTAELSAPFSSGGGINGSARVAGGSGPLIQRPLEGSIDLAVADMGFLNALSSEVDSASGSVTGDVAIKGTLAQPVPSGTLRVTEAALALVTPGLDLSGISVEISSMDGERLAIDGRAMSGGGEVRLDGSARLAGADTNVDLDIEGKAFEIVNTVDARVFVSPDLQLSLTESGIAITGELKVPRAEITPKELPQSVTTASSDVVVITEDAEPDEGTAAAARRELEANIRVVLGDAVSVDGFGFKGRLTGGVTVTQKPGQPTLGSGEVNIVDGEYRAYGQGLVIDEGKILFAGGPVDSPGLSVRALRRPAEDIVVGVRVKGPLRQPDFTVFSEPGMSQAEQLSWLVLGRPLEGTSEGESDMITQAALALGLKGGNFLADRIGEDLGVDSIGFETGTGEAGAASDVSQAAFVVGKYLSPELFVSYGIGLFNSVSTVKFEYSLGERWKVSTESSTLGSSGDVHYTIER